MKPSLNAATCALLIFLTSFFGGHVNAQPATMTPFSFFLDEPCKTSAGVYTPDGTLVRTLWSKVRYPAGTNSAAWDGLDDNDSPVAAGTYEIRLLQHNTEYVWDGAIGNTSAEKSGPTVHTGFYPMRAMAIADTNAFYVSGYNEGGFASRKFLTTDPQHVVLAYGGINTLNWSFVAVDADRVYYGCTSTRNLTNTMDTNRYFGAVGAFYIADNTPVTFSNGMETASLIFAGTQPGMSGISVQQNGNLLAMAVAPDNSVYLVDKQSGAPLGSISVNSPGRLSFSPDGSLWVISSNNVICFSNVLANPTATITLGNFAEPLDVAVNPTNANLILVADGGTSQQVKAFDATGAALWTYGQSGGYQLNGPAVMTNKFWFFDGENDGSFICFASDGSFWLGDGGNNRSLHFSPTRNYLEAIMYQPLSIVADVDQNNPTRVFNGFLEFSVDYTRPLSQAWTLVNNWQGNVDEQHYYATAPGLLEVTTFTNGRTYGLIDNVSLGINHNVKELCELTTNGLRMTGIFPMLTNEARWITLGSDGSALAATLDAARWYESSLNGFDASNNPVWNPETLIASAPEGSRDPFPRSKALANLHTGISTNNVLVSLDPSLNNGNHLGGIKLGSTNWLWEASPAVAYMNGLGNYEIANSVDYGGNTAQVLDRQIIYGYTGEHFRSGAGQACQNLHYYDDGLFVGEFGECNIGHYYPDGPDGALYEGVLAGCAGNEFFPTLVSPDAGDYYLWVNDEAGHGPQRWHFANARNIREQCGIGSLGSQITLTNQASNFPVGVTGTNGNQTAELTWQPVPGATAYRIRYALMNGGPFTICTGTTTNNDFVVGGLCNGTTYYFTVSAIFNAVEGIPSEQVVIHPFDTTQYVLCSGVFADAGQNTDGSTNDRNYKIELRSNLPALGLPAFMDITQPIGALNLLELDDYGLGTLENEGFGARGYVLYQWPDADLITQNIPSGFNLDVGSVWILDPGLEWKFSVDEFTGPTNSTAYGVYANPNASINISVTDTNFHYLTVVSPSRLDNNRHFILQLTSTNNPSNVAAYKIDEPHGYSRVFQFKFRGNVTLSANATDTNSANFCNDAILQALFFDDAPITFAPVSIGTLPVPIQLTSPTLLPDGTFQFSFTNDPAASYTVLTTTNLSLPLTDWTSLGAPVSIAPGRFQFTSAPAMNNPQRFYQIRSP